MLSYTIGSRQGLSYPFRTFSTVNLDCLDTIRQTPVERLGHTTLNTPGCLVACVERPERGRLHRLDPVQMLQERDGHLHGRGALHLGEPHRQIRGSGSVRTKNGGKGKTMATHRGKEALLQ